MSNILPEDVKLIAEFMGTIFVPPNGENCAGCSKLLTCKGECPSPPKYDTSMDEQLKVMDKLQQAAWGFEIDDVISGKVLVRIWHNPRGVVHSDYANGFLDLPRVLFPLLIKAIKQTKGGPQ